MDAPAVLLIALAAAVVGWFVLAPIVAALPDPAPLATTARLAIAAVNCAGCAYVAHSYQRWWAVVALVLLAPVLVVVSAIDLRVYRIPDTVVFPSLAAGLVLVVSATFGLGLDRGPYLTAAATGMCGYFVLLLLPHLAYPKALGFGDVKLALFMGLYLGWVAGTWPRALLLVFQSLFVAGVLGVVIGVVTNLVRGRRGAFPFGPALCLACYYAVLNADRLLPP